MQKYTLASEGAFRHLAVRGAKKETTKTESLVATTVIRKKENGTFAASFIGGYCFVRIEDLAFAPKEALLFIFLFWTSIIQLWIGGN